MMRHHPEPLIIPTHSTEFPWAADAPLGRQLTTGDRRPNLLIRCHTGGADRMLQTLMQSCEPPFHLCTLPGPLALPSQQTGTFFLENASALTLAGQRGDVDALIHLADRLDRLQASGRSSGGSISMRT